MDAAAFRTTATDRAPAAVDNIKWLAIASMVIDHVNKYLLAGQVGWMYAFGRLAFPMFVGVLGYKLATCDAPARRRVIVRLAAAAAVSLVPYCALGQKALAQGWWPLCVLWTLLVVAVLVHVLQSSAHAVMRAVVAVPLFVLGGALGEFWWPGVGLGLSIWMLARQPTLSRQAWAWVGLALCTAALCWINGNAWALLAAPCAAAVVRLPPLPRWRLGFYAFYPAHLMALWAWRACLGH